MKRMTIAVCILVAVLALLLYSCEADFIYGDSVLAGNLYFEMHRYAAVCRAEYGVWNGQETSLEIEIPNEVDGHRVTVWGNDYPAPFAINLDRASMVCGAEILPENAQIVPLHLSIRIGDHLREIREIEMRVFYRDRDKPEVYYQILVSVWCSPENPHFYSENGKLYQKRTGSLIDLFYYQTDYIE